MATKPGLSLFPEWLAFCHVVRGDTTMIQPLCGKVCIKCPFRHCGLSFLTEIKGQRKTLYGVFNRKYDNVISMCCFSFFPMNFRVIFFSGDEMPLQNVLSFSVFLSVYFKLILVFVMEYLNGWKPRGLKTTHWVF